MVLLHEDGSHFNLIISKDSDLAKLGSLSYRFNVGPIVKNNTESTSEEKQMKENESDKDKIVNLEKELKKCKDDNKRLKSAYTECEKEVRLKTEETEILKSEVKDLKEIIKLNKLLEEEDSVLSDEKENTWKEVKPKKSNDNDSNRKSSLFGSAKRKEREYNCSECDYQGTKEAELNKHINLKHKVQSSYPNSNSIVCRNCGEQFSSKWNLMTHRKSKHTSNIAYCRNYMAGRCDFNAEMCWWNHSEVESNIDEIINCFICNRTFESKTEMMKHRKREHIEVIRPCRLYQNKSCRFVNDACWFKHVIEDEVINHPKENHEEERMATHQVFRKVSENLEPPLKSKL